MESNRVTSEGVRPSNRALGVLVLFGLVPLAAVLTFLTIDDSKNSDPRRTSRAQEDPIRESRSDQGRLPPQTQKPEIQQKQPEAAHGSASTFPGADRSSGSAPNSYVDEDAARLVRFDENAQAFDERLAAFDREQGQVDESASEKAQEALQASLQEMHPEVRVTATCTASVCVVELTSPDPVGTMIAKIAPWLRMHAQAASGDPVDSEDENSLRLAFEKRNAPGNF